MPVINPQEIEFGLDSFVPISVDESGHELSGDVVIRNTVEEAVLADAVGIDSFNIAEHYRKDMMDSAASIILATIAGRTKRIRLGTAVTVLSTQDPGRESSALRSQTSTSALPSRRAICRCGLELAAVPSRLSEPRATASRSCWPLSAGRR